MRRPNHGSSCDQWDAGCRCAGAYRVRFAEQAARYREKRLADTYGMTPAMYDDLLDAQGGGCAICGATQGNRFGDRLSIDHDHDHCPDDARCLQCVRGLLCTACNLREGVGPAATAWAEYLARPRPFAELAVTA